MKKSGFLITQLIYIYRNVKGNLIGRLNEDLPGSLKFDRNSTLLQSGMEGSNEIALGK